MAVIYATNVKNARLNAVNISIGTTAVLEIGTTDMASVLASIPLDNPVAPPAVDGVMTFSGFPKTVTAIASGIAAAARIKTSETGVDVVYGLTVGLAAANIILDSVNFTAGQTVKLNSASIVHALP